VVIFRSNRRRAAPRKLTSTVKLPGGSRFAHAGRADGHSQRRRVSPMSASPGKTESEAVPAPGAAAPRTGGFGLGFWREGSRPPAVGRCSGPAPRRRWLVLYKLMMTDIPADNLWGTKLF